MSRPSRSRPSSLPLATVCPDLSSFFVTNGRLPHLGDPQAPWTFRGWSLPYVIEAERVLDLPPRWDYYFRTLAAGRLLDEPIPHLDFDHSPHRDVTRAIEQWLRILEHHQTSWRAFHDLVQWLAWALGVHPEPVKLDDNTHEALYRAVNLGPLLQHPHDALGAFLAEQRGNRSLWNPHAFFPTPHSVVRLMSALTLQDRTTDTGTDPRLDAIYDPALGTGRFLLEGSNRSLVLHGTDIDPLVLMIAKINGALYAPWLSFPLPASITTSSS